MSLFSLVLLIISFQKICQYFVGQKSGRLIQCKIVLGTIEHQVVIMLNFVIYYVNIWSAKCYVKYNFVTQSNS